MVGHAADEDGRVALGERVCIAGEEGGHGGVGSSPRAIKRTWAGKEAASSRMKEVSLSPMEDATSCSMNETSIGKMALGKEACIWSSSPGCRECSVSSSARTHLHIILGGFTISEHDTHRGLRTSFAQLRIFRSLLPRHLIQFGFEAEGEISTR